MTANGGGVAVARLREISEQSSAAFECDEVAWNHRAGRKPGGGGAEQFDVLADRERRWPRRGEDCRATSERAATLAGAAPAASDGGLRMARLREISGRMGILVDGERQRDKGPRSGEVQRRSGGPEKGS